MQGGEANGFMMSYVQQFQPKYNYIDTTNSQPGKKVNRYKFLKGRDAQPLEGISITYSTIVSKHSSQIQ